MRGHLSELQRLQQSNARLKNENAKLRERVAVLEEENRQLKQQLEKALLMIEELQRIVFRGGKKTPDDHDQNDGGESVPRQQAHRDAASYRRDNPSAEAITNEEHHVLQQCPQCQQELTQLKQLEFFTEDVVPPEDWHTLLTQVTRHWITTGYCADCQYRVSAVPIPKQKTSLGEQLQQLITFQSTVQQLSYSQIIEFAEGVLHLHLSEGEITNLLEQQSIQLEPTYLRIQKDLRAAPAVHLDETGWPTPQGIQGNYAWVAADAQSDQVLYALGQSRGKGNVETLLGKEYSGIGITDDYNGYKHAFQPGKHALCWAHPHRKLRDLKDSATLPPDKQQHCQQVFEEFSALYTQVRAVHARPFVHAEREQEVKQLRVLFDHCIRPHPNDPHKLQQMKARLAEQKDCYFVCLLYPNVPPDNNKAERSLRHLVIKRKKSFGSKTQKGADMLSILYSVVMSLWRTSKSQFFHSYSQALLPLV